MSRSIKGSENSRFNVDVIVACGRCAGGGSGGKDSMRKSRYSRAEQSAPSVPPKVIITPIPRRPQRNKIAAHDSETMGQILMGAEVNFTEERAKEVLQRLPEDQKLGKEPSGPCAYEVSQFIVCAGNADNLQDCEMVDNDLQQCKKKYKLPTRIPN